MNHTSVVRRCLFVALGLCLFTAPAAAQRPAPVIEAAAGWVGFADDGIVSETMLGGAARWYATSRFSIGPEVLYIAGDNHGHLVVTGNVMFDLVGPSNGRPARVVPFLVIGGGLFQTREELFSGTFTSREGAFSLGGGVRGQIGERVTAGVDARIGWEAHLRVGGFIGVQLGR